jgi:hypothetical protein
VNQTTNPAGHLPPPENAVKLCDALFSRIIGPLVATQVSALLAEPDNIEERVNLLVQTFQKNPYLIHPFRLLIKSLHTQEVEISLEEQIRFFTTKRTRSWLMVNLLNRVLNIKELRLDEATGRLPGKLGDILKYAHQAQDAFGEESRYKDLVYAAGLMFDYFFYLQRTNFLELNQTKYDEMISQSFKVAVEQGKLITHLSRYKKKLSLEKFTPLTAFLRQLSQISLVFLQPGTAVEFYKKLDVKKTSEPLKLNDELKAFGIHTGTIASYLAQSFPLFDQLGEVMSVWGFPYLTWLDTKKDIHDAAGMGEVGVMLHERLSTEAFTGSGNVNVVIPELRYLDFTLTAEAKSEIKI